MPNFQQRGYASRVSFGVSLLILGFLIYVGFQLDPTTLVNQYDGVYVYLVLFLLALVSPISTLTSAPFYAALVLGIAGGLDPYLVALVVTPGVTIGDSIFIWWVNNIKHLRSQPISLIERISDYIQRAPRWLQLLVVYLYFGFTPLSADIFLSVIALTQKKPFHFIPVIFLGNLTFYILLGTLALYGSPWLLNLYT